MHRLVLMDTSGLDALQQLHRALARQEIALVLCDLNEQPLDLVRRSGFGALLGDDRVRPDLSSALASVASAGSS